MPAPKIMIHVLTVRMSDMKVVEDRTINHNSPRDRDWLGKHCYWAFRNGHGVQTSPVESQKV